MTDDLEDRYADCPGALSPALIGTQSFYVDGADHLQIGVINTVAGLTLRVSGRQLLTSGDLTPFDFSFTPGSSGVLQLFEQQLAQGWILSCTVRATAGTPGQSTTFVLIQLIRGFQGALEVATLQQGYVTATQRVRFPGEMPGSGAGGPSTATARIVVGTTPGAGAEISQAVPTSKTWRLHQLGVLLTTSATVANRRPAFRIKDALGNLLYDLATADNFTASTSTFINLGDGFGSIGSDTAIVGYRMPIPLLALPAGAVISTLTAAIQAGDQYSAPILNVEEY